MYRVLISPHLMGGCRYLPTCSAYAIESIQKYGAVKGFFLAFKRILRCHPFCRKNTYQGEYDPVP